MQQQRNEPPEENKDDNFIRRRDLSGIQEHPFEDAQSHDTNTEIMRGGQNHGDVQFGPEKSAIGNQLEVASMASAHNSVMNTSPVRSSRVRSSRPKGLK